MAFLETAMPATARHGEPASEMELLRGGLDTDNNKIARALQVARLARLGFHPDVIPTLAPMIWEVQR